MRAVVVLPVPRGPENRYACETRSFFTAPWKRANDVVLTAQFARSGRVEIGGRARSRRRAKSGSGSRRPCTHANGGLCRCRGPKRWSGDPWHPTRSAESCWLPPLTRFTNGRRTGPDHRCGPRRQKRLPDAAPRATRVALLSRYSFHRVSDGIRGGVRERPNRHDWKSCEGKPSVGSNPTSSAIGVSTKINADSSRDS